MSSALRMRHLEVLLAVAAAGSMQRAAHQVHLTQPAISKIVRELETMFGATLFERSKRGVGLTECGRALVDRARYMLNDLERTREEIAAIGKGVVGSLRIGVLPVVESGLLPTSLLSLRKIAPALRIQIEEGTRPALIGSLRQGELDCVIGRLDVGPSEQDLQIVELVWLPVHLVTRSAHALAGRRKVSLADLVGRQWVLPRSGAPIRSVIDAMFVQAGLAPPLPLVESTSIRLNYELIRTSDMVGVMTADAAAGYAAQRKLALLPINLESHLPAVGAIMLPGRMSNAMGLYLRVLREILWIVRTLVPVSRSGVGVRYSTRVVALRH